MKEFFEKALQESVEESFEQSSITCKNFFAELLEEFFEFQDDNQKKDGEKSKKELLEDSQKGLLGNYQERFPEESQIEFQNVSRKNATRNYTGGIQEKFRRNSSWSSSGGLRKNTIRILRRK